MPPQVDGPMPSPDAKPTYHVAELTVSFINPDQNLYYLANPDTGRKVRSCQSRVQGLVQP